MPSTAHTSRRPARTSRPRRAWLAGALATLALACGPVAMTGAAAADAPVGSAVGNVLAVRGAVSLETAAGQQPLVVNAPIHAGDIIVSAAGKAQIGLNDGTIISIGENSRMRVADVTTSGTATRTRVGLLSGVLRLLVNKLAPSGSFEVETETAVAAVRGTDWVIESTPQQTAVAIVEGVVAVTARDPAATVVLDAPGQGTDVRRGAAPTAPTRWGAQRYADTLGRATFQ